MGREFTGYARNPEEPEPTHRELREEYISHRWEEIWDDPCLLHKALNDADIPLSKETARLLSDCSNRITRQLLSSNRFEMTDAERCVLAVADDVDDAVLTAATHDVDNGF